MLHGKLFFYNDESVGGLRTEYTAIVPYETAIEIVAIATFDKDVHKLHTFLFAVMPLRTYLRQSGELRHTRPVFVTNSLDIALHNVRTRHSGGIDIVVAHDSEKQHTQCHHHHRYRWYGDAK